MPNSPIYDGKYPIHTDNDDLYTLRQIVSFGRFITSYAIPKRMYVSSVCVSVKDFFYLKDTYVTPNAKNLFERYIFINHLKI